MKLKKTKSYLSGMSRSSWKGPFSKIKTILYDRLLNMRTAHAYKNIKILKHSASFDIARFCSILKSRSSVILNEHKMHKFKINSGKNYTLIKATTDHFGHRLGEFTFTTRRGSTIHRNNAKSKKNKSLKKK